MSQNLGRVRRSQLGFAPTVEVVSEIPHRPGHLTTKEILERVADRASIGLRRQLERWIENVEFPPSDVEGWESLLIQSLAWVPHEDLDEYHSEVEDLVRAIIYEEERRSHAADMIPRTHGGD